MKQKCFQQNNTFLCRKLLIYNRILFCIEYGSDWEYDSPRGIVSAKFVLIILP